MFDTVKCEYPLPLPEDLGECSEIDWTEFEFKTASFMGALYEYEITEDGELYCHEIEREWKDDDAHPMGGSLEEIHRELKKLDWTGEMMIHGVHLTEDHDYLFEFKLIFYKGALKETERETWKAQDASERKEMQKKMEILFEEQIRINRAWWHKLYLIWKFIIKLIFGSTRWIGRFISRVSYKIESWLT